MTIDELARMAAAYTERHAHAEARALMEEAGLVVEVAGSLDTGASADFLAMLRAAVPLAAAESGLVVDMGSVHYVSSTGIGALANAMLEYDKARISFRLRSVPPAVRDLFALLGLWSFFKLADPPSAPDPARAAGDGA